MVMVSLLGAVVAAALRALPPLRVALHAIRAPTPSLCRAADMLASNSEMD